MAIVFNDVKRDLVFPDGALEMARSKSMDTARPAGVRAGTVMPDDASYAMKEGKLMFRTLADLVKAGKRRPGALIIPLADSRFTGSTGALSEQERGYVAGYMLQLKTSAELLRSLGFQVSFEQDASDEVNALANQAGLAPYMVPAPEGFKKIFMGSKAQIQNRQLQGKLDGSGVYLINTFAPDQAGVVPVPPVPHNMIIAAVLSTVQSSTDKVAPRIVTYIANATGNVMERALIENLLMQQALGENVDEDLLSKAGEKTSLPHVLKVKIGQILQQMQAIAAEMATWA